jgi:hypothetical protein
MDHRHAALQAAGRAMGVAIIALAFAAVIGWHASKAHMSHRGIPVRKGQLRNFRGERTHHVIRLLVVAAVVVLILLLVSMH